MKKFNFLQVFAVLFLTIIMFSCNKENELTLDQNQKDLSNFKFEVVSYIDNEKVNGDLKSINEDLLIVERQVVDYENEVIVIERQGFTTEEGYSVFGDINNYPLRKELEFVKTMREYIEANGVEEYYEKYGELPKSYTEFETSLHTSMFPEDKSIPSLLIGITFAREQYGVGGHWVALLKTWPVMLPTWDNEVGSYEPIGLAGVASFYDKTFYRDHMFTRVQWAMTWYNVADNMISSWFRI